MHAVQVSLYAGHSDVKIATFLNVTKFVVFGLRQELRAIGPEQWLAVNISGHINFSVASSSSTFKLAMLLCMESITERKNSNHTILKFHQRQLLWKHWPTSTSTI